MKKYVVIGSSAAGVNGIRELRKYDKDAEIVLISKDKDIYSRCILHEYLAGKRSIERLRFVEKDFETLYRVNWKKGVEAVGLDREAKEVILNDGTRENYDKLLIATGSHTFFPPIKNMLGSPNMIGFRNIDDIEVLKEVAKTKKNIVVLGSGLVGIDCATGFLELGVKVVLCDFAGWLLNNSTTASASTKSRLMTNMRSPLSSSATAPSSPATSSSSPQASAPTSNSSRIPASNCPASASSTTRPVRPTILTSTAQATSPDCPPSGP